MKFYSELSQDQKNEVIKKLQIFPFTNLELQVSLEKTNPAFSSGVDVYFLLPESYKKLIDYLNENYLIFRMD